MVPSGIGVAVQRRWLVTLVGEAGLGRAPSHGQRGLQQVWELLEQLGTTCRNWYFPWELTPVAKDLV